jgi:hypothetical protein
MADTSKRIIYENEKGGVSIFTPASGSPLTMRDLGKKVVPLGREYWIVEVSTIPTDRTFRDAWVIDKDSLGDPDGFGEGENI